MKAGQHLDKGRFAGAVVTQQANNFLSGNMKIDAAQYLHAAKILVDVDHIDQRVAVFLLVFHALSP